MYTGGNIIIYLMLGLIKTNANKFELMLMLLIFFRDEECNIVWSLNLFYLFVIVNLGTMGVLPPFR